jgi:hypothetical protein
MEEFSIGTIVWLKKCETYGERDYLAVLVPREWAGNYWSLPSPPAEPRWFVRFLELPNNNLRLNIRCNGGWWIGNPKRSIQVVSEDEVPDHMSVLATRCLLDPDFVPFAKEVGR